MNTNKVHAVIPGLIAAAALVLSFSLPVNAATAIGFATVLMLGSMFALEYRLTWKRLLGR